MKYIITMRNPKNGKLEEYVTKADNRDDLQFGLDFWASEAGYTILSVKEERRKVCISV